jgi:ferric-dicitrate binding protein FerR (iron transport regulator)
MSARRRQRRNLLMAGAAASVLLAVFASLNLLRVGGVEAERVATIDKRHGSIFVLGDNAEVQSGNDLVAVNAGQTLVTDPDSGVGLAWSAGGSLRLDASTRVEFLDRDTVYLHSGRVYFDSAPIGARAPAINGAASSLRVATDFAALRHVGTQYMAQVDARRLVVSVREGEVAVDDAGSDRVASVHSGQQLSMGPGGAASLVNVSPFGDSWAWAETTAPSVNFDGRSVAEMLEWASHETGMLLVYESDEVRALAARERLNGRLDVAPRQALEAWMPGTRLGWRIRDGEIHVIAQD